MATSLKMIYTTNGHLAAELDAYVPAAFPTRTTTLQ
jgi:hypothetical protein